MSADICVFVFFFFFFPFSFYIKEEEKKNCHLFPATVPLCDKQAGSPANLEIIFLELAPLFIAPLSPKGNRF